MQLYLKTHDTYFVKGHPVGHLSNDIPITLLLIDSDLIESNQKPNTSTHMCKTPAFQKKKSWFMKKKWEETRPRESKLPGVLEPAFSGSFSSMHSSICAQRESKRCNFL
jgi:hypothetical protein